jgi:hypothetical protein
MTLTAFSGLVSEQEFGIVVRRFNTAISRTIDEDFGPQGVPSREVIKRRFDRCVAILKVLRGDMRWPLVRCLDHVGVYLRKDIDGVPWEPDARKSWFAADDGAQIDQAVLAAALGK